MSRYHHEQHDEKKILEGMNKIITDNLSVLLMSDTKISGIDVTDKVINVNQQKLLMPNV